MKGVSCKPNFGRTGTTERSTTVVQRPYTPMDAGSSPAVPMSGWSK